LAITKQKKQALLTDYVEKLKKSQAVLLTRYLGLNVSQLTQLRARLREQGNVYQIVKNTLIRLGLEKAGLPVPEELLNGPIALAYSYGDPSTAAKTLLDFAQENKTLEILGGILGSQLISAEEVKKLAELPPRPVLQARLLAALQGPMGNMVGILQAPLQNLLRVLQARAQQSEGAPA